MVGGHFAFILAGSTPFLVASSRAGFWMQRAVLWIVWIAVCIPPASGWSGDGSNTAAESGQRDSSCTQGSVGSSGFTPSNPAPAQEAAGAGAADANGERLAALWRAVAVYERIAARGGWPTLPDSTRLELGDKTPVVAVLKRRLVATGDLPHSFLDPIRRFTTRNLFDVETENALRRFQKRHGLEPDGKLGRRTLAALDVPAATRATQLRSNLWRAQHAPSLGPGRAILVNIPDYRLRGYENGRAVLEMRVVVGTTDDPTPAFSDLMTYVVFRPYWKVPTSIAVEEIVPQIRRDPRVLQWRNLE